MAQDTSSASSDAPAPMSLSGRVLVLVTAFLGWMLAGVIMVIGPLALRAAPISFFQAEHQETTLATLQGELGDDGNIAEMLDAVTKILRRRPTESEREGLSAEIRTANQEWRQQMDGLAREEITKSLGPNADAEDVLQKIKGGQKAFREGTVGVWFARYTCAFLLGAALGGLVFGWLGDRIGRAKAMGLSILWYSVWTGVTYYVASPGQLLVLRFVACMGVGGMWPNGVALASEAWSNVSRPLLSGLIGTSANLGFMLLAWLSRNVEGYSITPDHWRWVMGFGALPAVLGLFVLVAVPESPRWLAGERKKKSGSPIGDVFRPPLLKLTILGICLGAIPLMGNWGGANWAIPWSGQVGGVVDPGLKSATQWSKSFGGAIGALLGGWVASRLGRRTTYFVISLISLVVSFSMYRFMEPGSPNFGLFVFGIGFFGTLYFGWLPLFLPELFPTSVRATGSGVSFNFGRIVSALTVVFVTGELMRAYGGDYGQVGQLTCFVYVLGMIIIWFAPDTSKKQLED